MVTIQVCRSSLNGGGTDISWTRAIVRAGQPFRVNSYLIGGLAKNGTARLSRELAWLASQAAVARDPSAGESSLCGRSLAVDLSANAVVRRTQATAAPA